MEFTQSLKTTATTVKSCDYADYTGLDGYDWQTVQIQRGYWSNPVLGDWPYVVYANGNASGHYTIKEYAEHDVKTWTYQDTVEGREEYSNHLAQLKAYWAEQNL